MKFYPLRAVLLAVAFSSLSPAQEVTAGIYGIVQDASSAVVPGAAIRARNLGTGRTRQIVSDESGNYSFVLLPIGTYSVTAEANGFKKAVTNDVQLRVNDNRRIIFSMEVGQIADQITVEAAAISVNTASGATSQLLDGKDMIQLPARGRNVLPFALLMPGVVSTTPYDRRANNSAVNGIRMPGCLTAAITSTPAATGVRRWRPTLRALLNSAPFAATTPRSLASAAAPSSTSSRKAGRTHCMARPTISIVMTSSTPATIFSLPGRRSAATIMASP